MCSECNYRFSLNGQSETSLRFIECKTDREKKEAEWKIMKQNNKKKVCMCVNRMCCAVKLTN